MILRNKLFLACLLGFLFDVLCFPRISYGGNPNQDSIIGNWQPLYRECENDRMLIISDTFLITSSSFFLTKHSYSISESVSLDGSITLKLFDSKISQDNGLNFLEIAGNNDTIKANIFLKKDILVLLIWKGGDRSDEYQVSVGYTRKNESEPLIVQSTILSNFYLPDGYTGYGWVALDQPNGEPAEYDQEGRRVLRIPESGLLLTQAKPMPTGLAKREFAFHYQEKEGTTIESIPMMPNNCLTYFITKKLSDEKIKEYGFDPYQVYVYYYRYNNPNRENINKFFGKEIKGQVFWFRVDTLKNLLKSEPMIPRLQ